VMNTYRMVLKLNNAPDSLMLQLCKGRKDLIPRDRRPVEQDPWE
jgi:hypothetical protein